MCVCVCVCVCLCVCVCVHSAPPSLCRRWRNICFVPPLQGRGSGFPGRRRPRGAGLSGRGGRGRARGKSGASPSIHPGVCVTNGFTVSSYTPPPNTTPLTPPFAAHRAVLGPSARSGGVLICDYIILMKKAAGGYFMFFLICF